jgi:hypothetical protein
MTLETMCKCCCSPAHGTFFSYISQLHSDLNILEKALENEMGDMPCRVNECSGKAFWCKDNHFLTTAKCPAAGKCVDKE